MTREECLDCLGGLIKAFPNGFNQGRIERIYALSRNVRKQDFMAVCQHILDTSRGNPIPEDFRVAFRELQIKFIVADGSAPRAVQADIFQNQLPSGWRYNNQYVWLVSDTAAEVRNVLRSQNAEHPACIEAAAHEKEWRASGRPAGAEVKNTHHLPQGMKKIDFDALTQKP